MTSGCTLCTWHTPWRSPRALLNTCVQILGRHLMRTQDHFGQLSDHLLACSDPLWLTFEIVTASLNGLIHLDVNWSSNLLNRPSPAGYPKRNRNPALQPAHSALQLSSRRAGSPKRVAPRGQGTKDVLRRAIERTPLLGIAGGKLCAMGDLRRGRGPSRCRASGG